MQFFFSTFLFVIGAIFGSFLCCRARRLHLKIEKQKTFGSRSVCLHCKHQLKWFENLPLISWLILKGKCRYCHHKIGALEIISEFAVALSFLLLSTTIDVYASSKIELAIFAFILLFTLLLSFLAIYDGAYGKLPTSILTFSTICAIIIVILQQWSLFSVAGFSLENILSPIFSALCFGGLYLLLYLVSRGKWVGDGDWILASAIGLVLGTPWFSLIALFISNFSASIIMYPIIRKRKTKKIYFGPFLVFSFIIVYAFSGFFANML